MQNNDLFIRSDIVKEWKIEPNYQDLPDPVGAPVHSIPAQLVVALEQ